MIIENNIIEIIKHFDEEEKIFHTDILIVKNSQIQIDTNFLRKESISQFKRGICYEFIESVENESCFKSPHDLIIKIPETFVDLKDGVFRYAFQSGLRNIYGKYEVTIIFKKEEPNVSNKQFFTVSLGK